MLKNNLHNLKYGEISPFISETSGKGRKTEEFKEVFKKRLSKALFFPYLYEGGTNSSLLLVKIKSCSLTIK